jgi:hypothetical protein
VAARKKPTIVRELAPEWLDWIVENLLAGASPPDVRRALEGNGVPPARARAAVADLTRPTVLRTLRRAQQTSMQYATMARLGAALRHAAPKAIERVDDVEADAFFSRYFAGNTPVVITGRVRRWRAVGLWSPAYLRRELGRVRVRYVEGREREVDFDMKTPQLTKTTTLGAYAAKVERARPGNDLYLVAQNRNMDLPAMQRLWDDVEVPVDLVDPARAKGAVAFWFGPGGTVTPLHHDTCNILFCQVYGQKRLVLVPPQETFLLRGARSMYAALDPEHPDLQRFPEWSTASVFEVVLDPGDALFIPVGWWHQVRSLSVSINLAFANFRAPNSFDWYRPGDFV